MKKHKKIYLICLIIFLFGFLPVAYGNSSIFDNLFTEKVGYPNPSAVYCTDLGYKYETIESKDGGQHGVCIFPDDNKCDAWDFYRGKCGQEYSYCKKNGYNIKNLGENEGWFEGAICINNKEELGSVSKLMGIEKRFVKEEKKFSIITNDINTTNHLMTIQSSLPNYFDWRNNNGDWMTSVKDQKHCGSCWAFSAVGTVEAQYNIAKNNPNFDLDLSEEYLVSDCFTGGSCCGGWIHDALRYIKNSGVSDESCFPYWDQNCTCNSTSCNCIFRGQGICSDTTCSYRCSDWQNRLWKIIDWGNVEGDKESMKTYLHDKGPVSVRIDINSSNRYWDGDIMRCNPDGSVNHVVIITGYNETGGYWIVKNSWGDDWGLNEDGYFKLGFGECSYVDYGGYGVDVCTCSSWTAGSCGAEGCASNERKYTRTCSPSGCEIEEKCEIDASCSGGQVRNVCKSGCSYNNIQSALNAANYGDIIKITDEALYNEEITWTKNGITLDCQGATIDGQNSKQEGIRMKTGAYDNLIKNCNIKRYTDVGIYMTLNMGESGVYRNDIYYNNITENYYGFILRGEVQTTTIKYNNIKKNRLGILAYGLGGSNGPKYNEIRNSVISDNSEYGISLDTVPGGNTIIQDNITSNNLNGIYVYSGVYSASTQIQNYIISNNTLGIIFGDTYGNTVNSNTFCPVSITNDFWISQFAFALSGDENRCDKPGSWNDAGTVGCTYECPKPACYQDLDCGNNGFIEQPYCLNNDSYDTWRVYTCYNPGTLQAFCYYNDIDEFKQDCGEDYCDAFGSNYCKNDDVYHNQTCYDIGCNSGICFSNFYIDEQKAQECNYGCNESKCISPPGDINWDCKVDILDLAAVGICYGCKLGEGCWSNCSNADVKQDDKINIFDLATTGLNYGGSC